MLKAIIEVIGAIILVFLLSAAMIIISVIIALKIAQKIIDYRIKNNKVIEPKDKEQINKFIEKDYLDIISKNRDTYNIKDSDYWYLEDTIGHVESLCRDVLEGTKKLYTTEEDILEKDFEDFINGINDKNLTNINKELKKMKKIILKYYDKDGNLIK